MSRTITVKGVGTVSAAPDYVVITMKLETKDREYEPTLQLAATAIGYLNTSLEGAGFEKKAVKTTNFDVHTDYDRVKDPNGNYHSIFRGYVCTHHLKLAFDFDTKRLAQALGAISKCLATPELSISFTVKNPSAVKKELLRSAALNAREKVEVLCEASGVELGELISITYNWSELEIISNTRYCAVPKGMIAAPLDNMEIEPDDIDCSDTATFVWEIK